MSNPTTGEWTAETLWEFIGGKIDNLPTQLSKEDVLACYSAINAALGAEREKWTKRHPQGVSSAALIDANEEIQQLRQQLAAAIEALREASRLLAEVRGSHHDPDDANYNECDKPGEECQWCVDSRKIDVALAKIGYPLPDGRTK